MKPEIENLKMWMSGRSTTGYQRALAMREFEKLLSYVNELEQLSQPNDGGKLLKLRCTNCGVDELFTDTHCNCCGAKQVSFSSSH